MPEESHVETKGSHSSENTDDRVYNVGAIILFGAWALNIIIFYWIPFVAFVVAAIVSGVGFHLCLRRVADIEQRVDKQVNINFFFKIQNRRRIAYLMMALMILGEFILAISIEGAMNAGTTVVEALYNATVDNAFEITGVIGFIICSVGMFSFLFATLDVVQPR